MPGTPTNQNFRIMSKWVQFYHKITKYDLANHKFLWGQEELVEMVGMDSIMPVDARFSMASIRAEIQRKIDSMKRIEGFDPCAFSILSGPSLLCAHESQVYDL